MQADYVFVGAGLASALSVLALAARRPGARVALVERAPRMLGNHTWCFHEADVSDAARAWLEPAVAVRWPRYQVKFPSYERTLSQAYSAVTVGSLEAALEAALARLDARVVLGRTATRLAHDCVELDDGTRIEAQLVIDARGPEPVPHAAGYQKFVGYELSLRRPVALAPVVMDATVAQHDGFRFLYVLPLAPERVLLEDTYYASSPALDVPRVGERVLAYARELGLDVASIVRTEQGVLPLPSRAALLPDDPSGPLRAGYRGGFFHPVTGYSFPLAVRLATHLADLGPTAARGPALAALIAEHAKQARFLRLLNRLLFGAMPDAARRNVLERFYRLPAPTIARFYAMTLTPWDRARIVCGRPPRGLSLSHALFRTPMRLSP